MMRITQDMDYAGLDEPVKKLVQDLQDYHQQTPFRTGIDWQFQTYWATMTDEQAFAFILKHPEYQQRFRKTED